MLELVPHGGDPVAGGVCVRAEARRRNDRLWLSFALVGNLDRIRVPAPTRPCMAEGLWRRTCFEAFIARAGAASYHEINLSPSSAWAVYAFRSYRAGGVLTDPALAPEARIERARTQLRLEAVMPLGRLDDAYVRAPLQVGLSAVVQEASGACSHWALAHAPGAPDFHRAACWTLRLEATSGACDGESS